MRLRQLSSTFVIAGLALTQYFLVLKNFCVRIVSNELFRPIHKVNPPCQNEIKFSPLQLDWTLTVEEAYSKVEKKSSRNYANQVQIIWNC